MPQLNEGIKYFKDSEAILKYIAKMEKRIASSNIDEDSRNRVTAYLEKLRSLSEKLSEVEGRYASSSSESEKFSAKQEYKKIKLQNISLFKEINNERFKKALISSGAILGILAIFSILSGSSVFINKEPEGLKFISPDGKMKPDQVADLATKVEAVKMELVKEANKDLFNTDRRPSEQKQFDSQMEQIKKYDELIDKIKNVNKIGLFGMGNFLGFL